MAQNSKIEWCHHTANLWWGCTKVHSGCDNCYAEYLSETRYNKGVWGNDKPRLAVKSAWKDLLKFQKLAAAANERHRVFVGSMMDIFEKPMPLLPHNFNGVVYDNTGQIRDSFFREIVPSSPNLIFLLLTKRPSNINKYIPEEWLDNPPANVMFGTSVSEQDQADTLVPQLLNVKGKRFLSVEPQLGWIDLTDIPFEKRSYNALKGVKNASKEYIGKKIDWVIVGGESGHGKRPFNCDWARTIRDDCKNAETPFFMKQVDKVQPIPDDLMIREFPEYHKNTI